MKIVQIFGKTIIYDNQDVYGIAKTVQHYVSPQLYSDTYFVLGMEYWFTRVIDLSLCYLIGTLKLLIESEIDFNLHFYPNHEHLHWHTRLYRKTLSKEKDHVGGVPTIYRDA